MDEWKEIKRTGEMEFHQVIRSARLRRLLSDVWEALPVDDRLKICDRLAMVTDAAALRVLMDGEEIDRAYGYAVQFKPDRYFIFLNASEMRFMSAAFACYVIAHELGHVYHGHKSRRNKKKTEAEADATAARWGYSESKLTIEMGGTPPSK